MLSRGVQVHGDIASQSGSVFVGNPSFSANSINFNDRRDSDKYQCLRELYFTDSNVEKARLETREDILIETSYNWIFQDDSFQTWLSDEKSQILRITGEPGKGKTMAMIGIINNLAQRIPPKPSAIAFYFCRATDDKLSAFSGVIRGLLHHLLSQKSNEVLIRHLQAKFDKAGSGIFEGSTVGFALQDVLLDILQDAAFEAFYFIVDALDECKSGLNDLLKLIRTTTSKSRKIKWLVSSRNNLDVDRFFRCLDNATTINLEQHATEIGLGIQEYIENRVDILRRRHEYNTDQAKQITAALSSKAEGTFLWIHLACQSLDKTRRAKAVRSLEIMPSGLNAMYERMAQILQEINQDDEDRLLCQLILSAVTVAVRPLRVPELLAIINMASPDPEDIAMELTKLIARCGSFLSLQGDTIYFVHQSAREYLADNAGSQGALLSGSLETHNWEMAANCLLLFRKRLRQDVCGLKRPGFLLSELNNNHIRTISDLEYACCNWAMHICLNQHTDLPQSLETAIDSFLDKDLLHWVEALSIFRNIGAGIVQLTHLCDKIKINLSASNIKSAKEFMLEQRMTLEAGPLQVYSAAIMFSSQSSWVKSHHDSYIPSWIEISLDAHSQWNGLLRVFGDEDGRISAIAISSDDQFVAASPSSTLLQLWNIDTGCLLLEDSWRTDHTRLPANPVTRRRELDRHMRISDIKFSKDNKNILLILASDIGTMTAFSSFDIMAQKWLTLLPFQCLNMAGGILPGAHELLALSPDGMRCAGYSSGIVVLFSTADIIDLPDASSDSEITKSITICDKKIEETPQLRFSSDSNFFVVTTTREIALYHGSTGSKISHISAGVPFPMPLIHRTRLRMHRDSLKMAHMSGNCRTVVRTHFPYQDIEVWTITESGIFELYTFPLRRTSHQFHNMTLSESGRWLILTNQAGSDLIDLSQLLQRPQRTGSEFEGLDFSYPKIKEPFELSDGKFLCQLEGNYSLRFPAGVIWDLDSHMMREVPMVLYSNVPEVSERDLNAYFFLVSHNRKLLITADRRTRGGKIALWNIDDINNSGRQIYPNPSVSDPATDSHSRHIGGTEGQALPKNTDRDSEPKLNKDHGTQRKLLAISNDGLRMATIRTSNVTRHMPPTRRPRLSHGATVQIWDTTTHRLYGEIIPRCPACSPTSHAPGAVSVAFSSDSQKIAISYECSRSSEKPSTEIQIWGVSNQPSIIARRRTWLSGSISALTISPDNTTVIFYAGDQIGHWVVSTDTYIVVPPLRLEFPLRESVDGIWQGSTINFAPHRGHGNRDTHARAPGFKANTPSPPQLNTYAYSTSGRLAFFTDPESVVLYDFRSGAMIGKVVGSDVQTVRAAATSITLKLPVEAEDCVVKFADGRIAICSGTAGSLIVTHGDNPDLDTSAAILNKQVVHFSHGWFRMGRQAFIYTPPPYRPIRFYTSRSGIIAAEYPGGKIYTLKIDMEKLSKILDASM